MGAVCADGAGIAERLRMGAVCADGAGIAGRQSVGTGGRRGVLWERQETEGLGRRHGQVSRSKQGKSRRRRPRRAGYVIGAAICLAVMSGIGTVTLARYADGVQSDWLPMIPEKFYFTSNVLESGRDVPATQLYNWNPEQDYVFFMDIRNWADDFRVTPKDISYSVTIKADGASKITEAVNGSTAADGTYTVAGGLANTQKLVIRIPAGQKPAGNQLEVKVKARPAAGIGYSRTLSGIFQLNEGAETCKVQVETHNTYIDLLIGVDKGQSLTVTWPTCLTPDNTSRWMREMTGTGGTITLDDEESCRLRYFVTGEIRTGDVFTVTEAGGAVQTIPLQ